MDVRDLRVKTALVTGAASGIGRETALECARRGADLVVCDVDEEGLAATARTIGDLGRQVFSRCVDVASREEVGALAAAVHERFDGVDLLVNNAGVGLGGLFTDTSLEDWEWLVRTNLFGVIHGCHFFVPAMVERGRGGHVVNVASAAAYAPLPAQSAYAATKFAVLGLSESLRGELAPHGIGVTAICPGFIDTSIVASSRLRGSIADPSYRRRTTAFYRRRGYTPERVAARILAAVRRNRAVAPVSPEAWVMYYAARLAPGLLRWTNRKLVARLLSDGRAGR